MNTASPAQDHSRSSNGPAVVLMELVTPVSKCDDIGEWARGPASDCTSVLLALAGALLYPHTKPGPQKTWASATGVTFPTHQCPPKPLLPCRPRLHLRTPTLRRRGQFAHTPSTDRHPWPGTQSTHPLRPPSRSLDHQVQDHARCLMPLRSLRGEGCPAGQPSQPHMLRHHRGATCGPRHVGWHLQP